MRKSFPHGGGHGFRAAQVPASEERFDLVIVNGHVIDGTGSPWYSADIGIRAGHVTAIGRLREASRRQTIDAGGKIVAPGFIDMLGQSDLSMLVDPHVPSKIYQGITTEITARGNRPRRSTRRSSRPTAPSTII